MKFSGFAKGDPMEPVNIDVFKRYWERYNGVLMARPISLYKFIHPEGAKTMNKRAVQFENFNIHADLVGRMTGFNSVSYRVAFEVFILDDSDLLAGRHGSRMFNGTIKDCGESEWTCGGETPLTGNKGGLKPLFEKLAEIANEMLPVQSSPANQEGILLCPK